MAIRDDKLLRSLNCSNDGVSVKDQEGSETSDRKNAERVHALLVDEDNF